MDPYAISVFYILWIFLGNFILLNLFLAILLDSFLEEEEENDESNEEREERLKRKRFLAKMKQGRLDKHKVFMGTTLKDKIVVNGQNIASEEDLEDLDEDEIKNIFKSQGIISIEKEEMAKKPLYVGVECKAAFYLFTKDSMFRTYCYKSCKSTLWENTVLVLILLSSGKLGFDTYLSYFD